MKYNEPSWLHQWLQLVPGRAPSWFVTCNSCHGFDVFIGLHVALVLSAFLGWRIDPGVTFACLGALALSLVIYMWVEKCERLSRARIRRCECVRCGSKLAELRNDSDFCDDCCRLL